MMKRQSDSIRKFANKFALMFSSAASTNTTFGTGENQFEIEFSRIGNPGNTADVSPLFPGLGSVNYVFGIGTYQVSRDMVAKADNLGGLGLTMSDMSFVNGGSRPEMPASGLNWCEAARFVNWLNTSTGNAVAYKFNGSTFALWEAGDAGFDPDNRFRNTQSRFFLPSENEWYKAAYYDPVTDSYSRFAIGSDVVPSQVTCGTTPYSAVYGLALSQGPADIMLAGGRSHYGTMGQSGNLFELLEAEYERGNYNCHPDTAKAIRGGDWTTVDFDYISKNIRSGLASSSSQNWVGFRVATRISSHFRKHNSSPIR